MSTNREETLRLIAGDKDSKQASKYSCKEGISDISKVAAAPIRGAASLYGSVGQYAIHFDKEGLWLIGPVAGGAAISLTNEAVKILTKRYPDNKFIQYLNKGLLVADHGLVSLSADFGFFWNMITTVGVEIAGVKVAKNVFGNFYAPLFAVLPAIPSSYVNYHRAQGQTLNRSLVRHGVETLRGIGSNLGSLNILRQQSIIAPDSLIPIIVATAGGGLGLVSSLSREYAPHFSKFCDVIIELCFNLSLSANEFNLLMSIVAASNNDEIPEGIFYPNLALTTFLYLLLISNLLFPLTPCCKTKKADITEIDDNEDEKDIEAAEEVFEEENDEKAEERPLKSPPFARRNLSIFSSVVPTSNDSIASTEDNLTRSINS